MSPLLPSFTHSHGPTQLKRPSPTLPPRPYPHPPQRAEAEVSGVTFKPEISAMARQLYGHGELAPAWQRLSNGGREGARGLWGVGGGGWANA
jgi:hypothetical protein